MQVFGKHNMQNLQAACLACQQIGIQAEDFYRVLQSFTGASNRLEKVAERAEKGNVVSVAYKDFAHSPSKLRATIKAVKERYPDLELVACMELHTFSSLMEEFLVQYKDCMALADRAFVYFNPKVIEHKKLKKIAPSQVADAFGTKNVVVFTDTQALQDTLRAIDYTGKALLMMSSGTFDGINIKEFVTTLIHG